MDLTVLVDNLTMFPNLQGEYGLSLYIENAPGNILMDTGQGFSLFSNAEQLGLDLSALDHLVLSHGHFDHVGGVARFLTAKGEIPVWAHPDVTDSHTRLVNGKGHFIGCHMNTNALDLRPINGLTQITENVWAIEVPESRRDPLFRTRPAHLVVPGQNKGEWELDPFVDDISLVIKGKKGLSVLLGCAHAGVANILEEVARQFNTRLFHAVVGGMHIGDSSDEFINRVVDKLVSDFTVSKWRPSHCTGFKAAAALATKVSDVSWAGAGTRISL